MSKMEEAKADYLAGMKYKDIAKKYSVSLNTVKSWKTRNKWQRKNATKKKSVRTKEKSMHTKPEKVAPSLPPPELPDSDELNDKQKAFCLYYLQRYNATWAYQKAYGGSYNVAMTNGPRLLGNARIKSYLAELKKQQSQDLYLNANDILKQLAKQAFANYGDYIDFGSEEVPEVDAKGMPVIDPETGDYMKCTRSFVNLKNKDEVDTSLLKKVSIGRDGVIVELMDQQKALQLLLDRLPEPEVNDDSTNSLLKALKDGMKEIWSDKKNEDDKG
ncbi:terminase small subunit [Limosilactobacillus sp. STM2_1]|uniref:Terminase small subunit n=1 Tax=Limosilactobacillus rudii TaxID=2759755 RepID=A0A7W3UKF1_9LACO|nr:terminase small subunit [Limosilactobacillus rudii]MBB1078953.1 terminase small subunit [Limosilactobacillus rudii]MBB1097134.1 terminase small subunit [Limosilactobacillus rudii]MCD7134127.1 terminase small subunit [Limosilactobacillus rudii]